ncbi:hypothetical protein Pcinc_036748 [Petrolisthes cinctipes]|uniref:Uncharacterized protein n=1 Tax=Petrolisthes cinctipes TaxID=88211 RepID=A0AAE1BXC0_PETCI|nr:hypothetical protein Pcinc_036748 [Petrolisthes cinctipes]
MKERVAVRKEDDRKVVVREEDEEMGSSEEDDERKSAFHLSPHHSQMPSRRIKAEGAENLTSKTSPAADTSKQILKQVSRDRRPNNKCQAVVL